MQMRSWQVEAFGKPLVQALREVPAPTGTEVVLRVSSCGVCHSDVHMHDGFFDLGGGHRLDLARTVQPPRTLGHEIAGTVAAIGPEVQGVPVGARNGYVPNVVYSCGGMVHDRTLLLPYAVADTFTRFGSVPLDALLAAME